MEEHKVAERPEPGHGRCVGGTSSEGADETLERGHDGIHRLRVTDDMQCGVIKTKAHYCNSVSHERDEFSVC